MLGIGSAAAVTADQHLLPPAHSRQSQGSSLLHQGKKRRVIQDPLLQPDALRQCLPDQLRGKYLLFHCHSPP